MEWKAAWSYLPVNHNFCIATIADTTLRGFFKNTLYGHKIRIRFANAYSPENLTFEHVTIGKRRAGSGEITDLQAVYLQADNSNRTSNKNIDNDNGISFKEEKIVLKPGEELLSEEICLKLNPGDEIVLSTYVKEPVNIYSVCSVWSARSWNTCYGIGQDYTMAAAFPETDNYDMFPVLQYDVNRANHIFGVCGVEVLTEEKVKTVALFGDSITHMSYYSDALTEKVIATYPGKLTFTNRGLGGNRLLNDYTNLDIPSGGSIFGGPGAERFERDIYSWDKPEYVVVLIGINDFTHPYFFNRYEEIITLEDYKKGMKKLIDIAHSKGSKIYLGTVIPFKKDELEWFDKAEAIRLAANQWIREQKDADGYIDFDQAVRDQADTGKMLDSCHIGDGIHPNTEGGQRMADAVPIELFIKED